MSDFTSEFIMWLDKSVSAPISDDVKAYSVNLFEHLNEQSKYGAELIGAGRFDTSDEDWACDEVWWPNPRSIDLPLKWSGSDWQTCLNRVRSLLSELMYNDSQFSRSIKSSEGLGVGFVDGNIDIVWQQDKRSS